MDTFTDLTEICNELRTIEDEQNKKEEEEKHAFNIFTILRHQSEEVGLHSRFIAELLNPDAGHKTQEFQRLFFERVVNPRFENNPQFKNKIALDVKLECDYEIGVKSDGKSLGRIDICLKGSGYAVVIENKIYAGDQENQLGRYYTAAEGWASTEKIFVMYLTLYGDDVSAYGRGKCDDYVCISYQTDILNWLEACLDVPKLAAHIKETIEQYKRLVEKMTGQVKGKKMAIKALLQEDYNFKLIQQASMALEEVQIDVQMAVWEELHDFLKKEGFSFRYVDGLFQPQDNFKSDLVQRFYNGRSRSKNYGLTCKIGNHLGYEIHVYIEINECLYFGLTAAVAPGSKRGKHAKKLYPLLKEKGWPHKWAFQNQNSEWFIGGTLYPTNKVNFFRINEMVNGFGFADIVDRDNRKAWVDQTGKDVVDFIQSLKEIKSIVP